MAEALTITLREGLGIAAVMARNGVRPSAIGAALGADMPDGPRATFANRRAIVGTGPGAWLVFAQNAGADFADTLGEALAGHASVSDQSSAYIVQRLSGPRARTLLQRGVAIDLHPDAFHPGSAATTVIAHIGVILCQVDERPTYDVAVFRSYAASFAHWLELTAVTIRSGSSASDPNDTAGR